MKKTGPTAVGPVFCRSCRSRIRGPVTPVRREVVRFGRQVLRVWPASAPRGGISGIGAGAGSLLLLGLDAPGADVMVYQRPLYFALTRC